MIAACGILYGYGRNLLHLGERGGEGDGRILAPIKGAREIFTCACTKGRQAAVDVCVQPCDHSEKLCESCVVMCRKHGSMLWPDLFGKGTERVPGVQQQLYTLFGLQPPWIGQEASFMWAESGQLLFDRSASSV